MVDAANAASAHALTTLIRFNRITIMKEITYNNKTYKIPKPFNECFFGKEPTKEITLTNRFSGESATVPAFAVAIYDTIIGAEQTQNYDLMQKGLDWFSRNFTKQYMTLLD